MVYVWWAMPQVTQIVWHCPLARSATWRFFMHLGAYGMLTICWPVTLARFAYDEVFGPADEE